MKTVLSIASMVYLAPLVVSTVLVCGWPEHWGGSINPLLIIAMSFFALFTVPIWLTYIPSIIIVPLVMRKISRQDWFRNMPIALLLLSAPALGALGGLLVMSPLILIALKNGADTVLQWTAAGSCSGAVTFTSICCIHRFGG